MLKEYRIKEGFTQEEMSELLKGYLFCPVYMVVYYLYNKYTFIRFFVTYVQIGVECRFYSRKGGFL